MELGIIGIGKMGGNSALQCSENGIPVGKARRLKPELTKKDVKVVKDDDEFVRSLKHPRVIYMPLPAGQTIDKVLKELVSHIDKDNVVMDVGNSYYKESIRREAELSKLGIHFVNCSISGGIYGARYIASIMVGGKPEAIK
jgi:6-phosphogluconate dehydrogenase